MTREDWFQIKRIASAALDCPADNRRSYVAVACGGDQALEREVQALLSFSDKASRGFETSAFEMPTVDAVHLRGAPDAPAASSDRPDFHQFARGTTINGRYQVQDVAGAGGMGAVYRVTDLAQQRILALKAIRGDTQFVNLFKIEFRTLVELRHPHLARSYDFEPIVGSPDYCFTMDFVEGRNIFDATTGLGWRAILDLVVQMCRVLAYVHNRGLVHRDIKPNNVLVEFGGTLKLVDFGLVGCVTDSGPLMGTPAYLAPELIDRHAGDHRSDLYSLGILIYQLLYRRLPFAADAVSDLLYQHAYSPVTVPPHPDVPEWLTEIIVRLCAKNPADRYRGANHVIDTINRLAPASYPVETAATRESYVVSGRFVGRQQELESLATFVERRCGVEPTTTGALALVSGESGVGKSRLVRELRHELQLNRQVFVEGNCFEGAAAEYGAFAEAIGQLLPMVAARGGDAILARHLDELVKVAPEIARFGTISPRPALTTPEAEQRRLLDSVAAFLADVTAVFPYVLYVNDLQWAPQGTVEILRYLHRRIEIAERQNDRVRLAVIGSYRMDETKGRPLEHLVEDAGATLTAIRLTPLPADSMQRLLISMFGLEEIPEHFVTRVLEEAAGSPFFLEEVVRELVENGSVFVADGSWRTVRTVSDLEIPVSITGALQRRLAMIARPEQLMILRVLAAYKKPMSLSFLSAVTHIPAEDVEQALYELSARHMVTSVGVEESLYRTAHDHLRTTVYSDLGPSAPALHHDIARALERTGADGEPPLSQLAHHYWLAEDRDAALKYALLAGNAALSVYANDEAIEHLEHALALLQREQTQARARATEQLADAYLLAGRYDRTKSLLMDLHDVANETIDKARVQRKLGEVVGRSAGTPQEAVDILWSAAGHLGAKRPRSRATFIARTATALCSHLVRHAARPMLPVAKEESLRIRLNELASIYLRIGYFSFFGDPILFFLPVLRAATVVDRMSESKEHSNVYALNGIAIGGLGFALRAQRYGENAIAEAERSGSAWHIANARSFHGMVLLHTGEWERALQCAELAREGFASCGDHFELAVSLYTILEVLQARGELREATVRGRQEVATFERLGVQMIGKGLFTQFGRVLAKTGDVEGLAVGRDVLARAQQGADKLSTALAHMGLGESLLHLGKIGDAIEHLEQSLAIRDRDRFNVYVAAQGSALLAQAYAASIRSGCASYTGRLRQLFDRRVSQAASAARRFPPMRSSARLVRGIQYGFRGRREQAMACFADAGRQAEVLGARLWQAEAHFESGMAYLEHEGGTSQGAQRELGKALALFRASGAAPSEQRSLDALSKLQVM